MTKTRVKSDSVRKIPFAATRMSAPISSNSSSYSDLLKQVRSHEVALAELNNLSSSRDVYQKNGNIFFRTTIQKAKTFEQTQLDTAKARLQKLGSS